MPDELMTYPVDLLHSFLGHAGRQDGVLRSHACIITIGLLHGWCGLHSCHVALEFVSVLLRLLVYPVFRAR